MTRKKSNYKPKSAYVSSPLFKMTKEQHEFINTSIRNSFKIMVSGKFTQRQWVDMLTRMIVGKLMIAKHYEEISAKEFEPCVEALVNIELRAAEKNHDTWDMTEEEKELLEAGLDAVEQIQVEVSRMDFLNAHREADKIITKMYINKRTGIEKGLITTK